MVARWPAALQRWLPDTLFGRLALLLIVAVIVSHVLALTLMFELRPAHPGHPPGPQPLGVAADGQSLPLPPPGPEQGLWNAPPSLQLGLLLDISVRLAALVETRLKDGPQPPGYLIAGHGLYVWGANVKETIRHMEAFDFLLTVQMHEEGAR